MAGTLLSLFALLGVSLVVARKQQPPAQQVVAGSFNAAPTASVRDAPRAADKRSSKGPRTPQAATPEAPAGVSTDPAPSVSTPAAGTASHPRPDTAIAGGGTTAATGEDAPTRIAIHPAKAGEWKLTVESRADGTLLDDGTGEARLYTDEPKTEGAEQRFVPRGRPLGAFGAATVRTLAQGRYLSSIELVGESSRPLLPAAAVVDVPSSWHPGEQWTWRFVAEDKATTLDATITMVGRENFTMKDGKTQVEVVRLDQAITISGDRSITLQRKVWFAPSLGVPVRVEESAAGTDTSGRPVDRQTTADLVTTEPSDYSIIPDQP